MKSFFTNLLLSLTLCYSPSFSYGNDVTDVEVQRRSCSSYLEAPRNITACAVGIGFSLSMGSAMSYILDCDGDIGFIAGISVFGITLGELGRLAVDLSFESFCHDDSLRGANSLSNCNWKKCTHKEGLYRSAVRQGLFWAVVPASIYAAYSSGVSPNSFWYAPAVAYASADAVSLGVWKLIQYKNQVKKSFTNCKDRLCCWKKTSLDFEEEGAQTV